MSRAFIIVSLFPLFGKYHINTESSELLRVWKSVKLLNDSDVNRLPNAKPFLLTMLPLQIESMEISPTTQKLSQPYQEIQVVDLNFEQNNSSIRTNHCPGSALR